MDKKAEKKLFSNTMFLYILTFSTQLLNFLTIPYLTRILGPQIYGKVGLALAYMSYVQLFLDFGFTLSVTQLISLKRDNKEFVNKIVTSATLIKIIFSTLLLLIVMLVLKIIKINTLDLIFYILYLLAYIVNAILPDFYYRGIEEMGTITIRTVLIKIIFTIFIFIFVNSSENYIYIPLSLLIGNLVAVIYTFLEMKYKRNWKTTRLTLKEEINLVKSSIPFFLSRISATIYQAFNTILIGWMYPLNNIMGYYSSTEKIVSLTKVGTAPIADSLYPYMLKNKNYKLLKKILLIITPNIYLGGIIVFIYAENFCIFLFGKEYSEAANILRCLIPCACAIFPSYILAFPTLSPIGLTKYANFSNIFGMILQIVFFLILIIFKSLNIYTICIATSITETMVLLFRLIILIKYKKRIYLSKENL